MIRAAVLAWLIALLLTGCTREPPPPTQIATPALWVIDDQAGAPIGWLFGTIHALPPGARWGGAALDHAVDEAGVLVVEVRDLDPARIAESFAARARDEPVPPLESRVAQNQRPALAAALARNPRAAHAADRLETWAAALVLARTGSGLEPGEGADKALLAQFAGRPIVELEGANAQLAIFDALPEPSQRRMLGIVLRELADPEAAGRALADAWLAGDLERIERAARTGLLADPALERALASGRNAGWLATLLPIIEAGQRPLIAVGTAHMLGTDGLPALLASQGYRVRRVQ
ncbi:TraB/GumN family protein [Qipengyuania sediminis]|uniref:TraB/GumN family protein n=1 Tax=Qipengyuania sediminis TaxID=1532023 RepID=UPI0010595A00|nr:TraB/GumN family protein [Qipengyuania sediminis]